VTLFRASEWSIGQHPEADMGWGRPALGGVEIHDVPGDHLSLMHEPHVQILAERLADCLRETGTHEGCPYRRPPS
jgi:thioesterase domain-containing protein